MNIETEQKGNPPDGDEVTDSVKSTKSVKMRVTDVEWLQEEAVGSESPAAVLSRLHDELLASRDSRVALEGAIDNYTTMIAKLERDIEDLRSVSGTALTTPAGQSSFGDFGGELVKDTMDAIKDVCDDEMVCVKTTLHLLDKRADGMNQQLDRDHSENQKRLDRDHSAEQKRLDREDKVKDREHKQYLAEKRAQHDKDLAMIKKGVVRKEDLEGVVFLGSMQKRKTAGEMLAERKKQAYHAAGADGDDDFDGELVDDGESDYGGMVDEG